MKLLISCFSIFILSIGSLNAQKVKAKEGDWKNLSEIRTYDLEFDYTDFKIPKYDSEEDFLKDKMQKREAKKAGDGERFRKSWLNDRDKWHKPKFIESFNKRFKNNEIIVGLEQNSEYVMKVKTVLLYPGYNVGVWRQNAKLEAYITVYKKSDPNEILLGVMITKVEGTKAFGTDFNSGERMGEAYAKLAKTFAKNLKKKSL